MNKKSEKNLPLYGIGPVYSMVYKQSIVIYLTSYR